MNGNDRHTEILDEACQNTKKASSVGVARYEKAVENSDG